MMIKNEAGSPWVSMLNAVLTKEGLVGALLAVMVCGLMWEHHNTVKIQTELNAAILEHMKLSAENDKQRIDQLVEFTHAIEALAK